MNSIDTRENSKDKFSDFIERFSKKLDKLKPELKKNGKYKIGDLEWNLSEINLSKKFIQNMKIIRIINNEIINPPSNNQDNFKNVKFNQNNLNILDALCYHGGLRTNYKYNKNLYSEHFGCVNVKNNSISDIKIFTNIKLLSELDPNILLPNTHGKMNNIRTIFHTHPVIDNMRGRLKEGIVFDYPSSSDIHHFSVHNTYNKLDNSIVVSQEGLYCIRTIDKKIKRLLSDDETDELNSIINFNLGIMKSKFGILSEISIDRYYDEIINNMEMNKNINKYLENKNIYIEYYPRIKKDGKYLLRPFYFKIK